MIELNNVRIQRNHLNIGDQDFKNLQMLCSRKKGDRLKVVDGQLKHMSFFDRVHMLFSISYRSQVHFYLSHTITHLTQSLDINEDNKAFIQELFFNKLNSMSRTVYKRDLSQHTFTLLKDLMHVEGDIPEDLQTTYKTAQLYLKMGNYNLSTGANTSFQVIQGKIGNESEKSLGIFKPSSGEEMSASNRKLRKVLLRKIRALLPKFFVGSASEAIGNTGYINEGAATIVDKHIATHTKTTPGSLVPFTHIAKMHNPLIGDIEQGSFQLWINEKASIAHEALGTSKYYVKKNHSSLDPTPFEFEKMVIFDVISGNFDRHGENWFILPNGSIKLIDAGWSMSPCHGEKDFHRESLKLYLWRILKYCENDFSDEAKDLIRQLADPANLDKLKSDLLAHYNKYLPEKGAENEKRVQCMEDRLLVLQKMMNKKISEVAAVRTKAQIEEVLSRT